MDEALELSLVEDVPGFDAIEGAASDSLNLSLYVENPTDEDIIFSAELDGGDSLPNGMFCTEDGTFGGTPEGGTARDLPYIVIFMAKTPSTETFVFATTLQIWTPEKYNEAEKEKLEAITDPRIALGLSDYWKNFADDLPLPDIESILTRECTSDDVYYLLQRFGALTVWNSDDLNSPGEGKLINIENASSLYRVHDFGSALVASPVDLYDSNRTINDAIQTAKAMAHEVDRRGWNIELAGFDKMVRATWVEIQEINRLEEKNINIQGYQPTYADYDALAYQSGAKMGPAR